MENQEYVDLQYPQESILKALEETISGAIQGKNAQTFYDQKKTITDIKIKNNIMIMASESSSVYIASLSVQSKDTKPFPSHHQQITDVAINPSYEIVASVSLDCHLIFYKINDQQKKDFKPIYDINFGRPIKTCDYLNSVQLILGVNNQIFCFDTSVYTGKCQLLGQTKLPIEKIVCKNGYVIVIMRNDKGSILEQPFFYIETKSWITTVNMINSVLLYVSRDGLVAHDLSQNGLMLCFCIWREKYILGTQIVKTQNQTLQAGIQSDQYQPWLTIYNIYNQVAGYILIPQDQFQGMQGSNEKIKCTSGSTCIRCTDNNIIITVKNVAHLYRIINPKDQEAKYVYPNEQYQNMQYQMMQIQ